MKRYNIRADYDVAGYGTYEKEDPDGEWVKYEDVRGMFQYKDQLRSLGVMLESEACSCERESKERTEAQMKAIGIITSWICPVHGYKRL